MILRWMIRTSNFLLILLILLKMSLVALLTWFLFPSRLRGGVAAGGKEIESLADVDDGAEQGEAGAERAEDVDGGGAEFEENGADGDQREEGARLAGPVGSDFHRHLKMTQDAVAAEEQCVAADDDGGEPDGKRAQVAADRDEAQGDEGGEEEELVGDGIEQGPECTALVPMAGEVAVDGVGDGGEDKDADGGIAPRLLAVIAVTIRDDENNKDRDEEEPEKGDARGPSHGIVIRKLDRFAAGGKLNPATATRE
jgi:hypothetical protein